MRRHMWKNDRIHATGGMEFGSCLQGPRRCHRYLWAQALDLTEMASCNSAKPSGRVLSRTGAEQNLKAGNMIQEVSTRSKEWRWIKKSASQTDGLALRVTASRRWQGATQEFPLKNIIWMFWHRCASWIFRSFRCNCMSKECIAWEDHFKYWHSVKLFNNMQDLVKQPLESQTKGTFLAPNWLLSLPGEGLRRRSTCSSSTSITRNCDGMPLTQTRRRCRGFGDFPNRK